MVTLYAKENFDQMTIIKTAMKKKKKHQKRVKKPEIKKKSVKNSWKKTLKKDFRKINSIKINKKLKQLKELSLILSSKKKKIIKNQIYLLRKISLHRLGDVTSQKFNKVYEYFKKKQRNHY